VQGVSDKNEQPAQTAWREAQYSCIGFIGLRPSLVTVKIGRQTFKGLTN